MNDEPMTDDLLIRKLKLEPGDRLVFMIDEELSPAGLKNLREAVETFAPGIPCLVLECGMKLAVLSADAATVADVTPDPTVEAPEAEVYHKGLGGL